MGSLIYRHAAYETLTAYYHHTTDMQHAALYDALNRVPSAQPERKKGKWIVSKFGADAVCSECKMYFKDAYDIENYDKYCRHCGTEMEELEVAQIG